MGYVVCILATILIIGVGLAYWRIKSRKGKITKPVTSTTETPKV